MSRNRPTLDVADDLSALKTFVEPSGLRLIDAGCGDGSTARALADAGASVLGLDPDLRCAPSDYGPTEADGAVQLDYGSAIALPVLDGDLDGVLFFHSLHHVPAESMMAALMEARRAIRPGGFLFVAEPEIDSPAEWVMRPFHDETDVRTAARTALDAVQGVFDSRERVRYNVVDRYADFAEYVRIWEEKGFDPDAIRAGESESRFAEARKAEDGSTLLDHPIAVDFFTKG